MGIKKNPQALMGLWESVLLAYFIGDSAFMGCAKHIRPSIIIFDAKPACRIWCGFRSAGRRLRCARAAVGKTADLLFDLGRGTAERRGF